MGDNGDQAAEVPTIDLSRFKLKLVIRMDPETRESILGGNVLGDRPICMMMLKEAELGIIEQHAATEDHEVRVERESRLHLPGRDFKTGGH